MEIVNHPAVVWYCEVGLMWGMNFRVRSFFLPTHDYTQPCDSQTLSGYDFSAVGYDFFLPMHTLLGAVLALDYVHFFAHFFHLGQSLMMLPVK